MKTNQIKDIIKVSKSIIIVLIAISSTAEANIYYVAKGNPSASNSNPGTENLPWLTIQHAADRLVAGDTLYIGQGIYFESLRFSSHSGIQNKPIVFRNRPGDIVTIESITASGDDPAMAINVSHVRFIGLRVHKATNSSVPIHITAGKDVILDSLEIWGPGSWGGVHINNRDGETTNVTVRNSNVHDVRHEGFYITSYNDNLISHINLAKNRVYDNGDEAFQISGESAPENPPSDILIKHNEIYNVGAWAIIHLYYAPKDVTIEGNYIHDCTKPVVGISLDGGSVIINNNIIERNSGGDTSYHFAAINISSANGSPKFNIYHNTIVNISRGYATAAYGIFIAAGAGTSDSVIKNNIFYNIQNTAIYNRFGALPSGEHNLFFNSTGGFAVYDDGIIYSYSNVMNWGKNNVEGDPLFVSVTSNDYHLQNNSPTIDAGTNAGVFWDYDHMLRPQGQGFDIGAYEYKYSDVQPSAPTNLRSRKINIPN